MAENVYETKPPEPPPKPPEVPKPTEQPNRSRATDQGQPYETQQTAQQDARAAVQSEYAKAMGGRDPDGLRPTLQVHARAVGQAKQMDLAMPQRFKIIMGDGSIKAFPEE